MKPIYKGYVKTDGKVPVEKLKGGEYRTYEQAVVLDSYAGVLAEDVILIDIDDNAQSDVLMDIVEDNQLDCIVRRTSRGRHFIFRNNGVDKCYTHIKLACGLVADIKIGSKTSVQALKVKGTERPIEWDCTEDGIDIQTLPSYLKPINSSIDFFNMKDGDGRDSALYGYILTLTSNGFSKEDSRVCISLINQYVLKDKLTEDDIERITRDEAFPSETFFKGKTFLHNQFATFLKNNNYIKRIFGQLCIYKDGVYVDGYQEIEAQMIKYLPELKSSQRIEVIKYLELLCLQEYKPADAKLIAFNNGILDITTMEMIPFSPSIVITNKIHWDYDENAYSEIADNTLNKIACDDESVRAILEEAIGYSFYRRNELSKSFFLTGESGANGKSTFLNMINDVVGDDNKASLGLEELDERFSVATLTNKLVNIGDDIADDFLQGKTISTFKKLVSGNEIKAEFKGRDVFFLKPYTKFFFSANSLPRTKSKGISALLRRLVIIPFDAHFTKDDHDFDPYIAWKLKDEEVMKYLIRIGIEGLKRVLENNCFTESTKVNKKIYTYEIENNPLLLFTNEKKDSDIIGRTTNDVYLDYKQFCISNGFNVLTLTSFTQELSKMKNITTIVKRYNGVVKRIYIYKEQ